MADWKKKKKGFGTIYTIDGIEHAVVDRRGLGLVASITFRNKHFKTVEDAKQYAMRQKKDWRDDKA
jgi:hypothetical protein